VSSATLTIVVSRTDYAEHNYPGDDLDLSARPPVGIGVSNSGPALSVDRGAHFGFGALRNSAPSAGLPLDRVDMPSAARTASADRMSAT